MDNDNAPLELRTRAVGPFPMNSYVLVCPHTTESVLIDPGDEPEVLREMLNGTRPIAILLTHAHYDHVGALDEMRAELSVPLLAHAGPHPGGLVLAKDRTLADGDTVAVGHHTLRAIYTPGHTQDMLCFALEDDNRVVVGDTIFEGGPGKTHSPEAFRQTLDTLRSVILGWPDETVCYPGHGSSFRLGDQRAAIEGFLSRDHGDFFGDAAWDQ